MNDIDNITPLATDVKQDNKEGDADSKQPRRRKSIFSGMTGRESVGRSRSKSDAKHALRDSTVSNAPQEPVAFEISLKHFDILGIIGEGAFGKVKRIERKDQKKMQYALKYINKKKCMEKHATHNMYRERIVLQSLKHPYIVNLKYAFQDDENLFMVLDIADGGDLRNHLDRNKGMKDNTLIIYTAEIGHALNYLHNNGIIHRDLKPENLLLDKDGHILLTDFNVCANLRESKPKTQSGTRPYMAPEMFLGKPYEYSIDWWAVGIILFECTYGKRPFHVSKETTYEYFNSTPVIFLNQVYHQKVDIKSCPLRESFYLGLLTVEVSKRLGSSDNGLGFEKDIKTHPWLSSIDWDLIAEKKLQPEYRPNLKMINVDQALVIDELMGGGDNLHYKARKGSRKRTGSLSEKVQTGFLKMLGMAPKPRKMDENNMPIKTKSELELEEMDVYYIVYNHELPDQPTMKMPSKPEKASSPADSPPKAEIEEVHDVEDSQAPTSLATGGISRNSSVQDDLVGKLEKIELNLGTVEENGVLKESMDVLNVPVNEPNQSQEIDLNHDKAIESCQSQAVEQNHSQEVEQNHSQEIEQNHSLAIESQVVEQNHGEAIGASQNQSIELNHSQAIGPNQSQSIDVKDGSVKLD